MEEKIICFVKSKPIAICAATTLIVVGFIAMYYYVFNSNIDSDFYTNEEALEKPQNVVSEIETKEKIKIYITGEVNSPGVLELIDGDRIEDAINKAGGITENASLDKVNLAYKLEDGQKVYIPNKDDKEEIEIVSTENGQNVINTTSKNSKIKINSASIEKLCEIPGVGEALAQRIIDYRTENGKFKNIEELKNVSGIGNKKFESIKNSIEL